MPYVVERILQQGEDANKTRWFVPTGFQSKNLIVDGKLQLGDIDVLPELDVTIDGADEYVPPAHDRVDSALNLIKGGGACQLREKILAASTNTFVVVADYRKRSNVLGRSWTQGVPVEVSPFAAVYATRKLKEMGSDKAQLRMGKAKAGPVVTDNNNFCIDAPFPEAMMRDPMHLLRQIKLINGVVEVGLFPNMCKAAYFGNEDGTITIQKADGTVEENVPFTP